MFETASYDRELLPDREVHRILDRITRTKIKIRQGRSSTWVPAPVDFSDLSSEYIGILYEGLLDFELKTAPAGDPVVFLAVGNQPALPLSRLEAMDDPALKDLLENMKDTSSKDEEEAGEEEEALEEAPEQQAAEEGVAAEPEPQDVTEEPGDERHTTRTRAEIWARRAVEAGKLVTKPRGALTPEKRLKYDQAVANKARQLVTKVILPGEWYLVRWGGTRKGSGTFYTRPGLAVPTVHRTLRPLAYNPPAGADGKPDRDAPAAKWTPKKPEEILALKVCDPGCGSGSFDVAALRFLTDAVYDSLHYHSRLAGDTGRPLDEILGLIAPGNAGDDSKAMRLPSRPEDDDFETKTKAVLRRYVVERCIYGVDLDPLAVELCRLALWVETMDKTLPFSFLDHKVKCGNSLVGAWFDQFQHYPVMAWKNREGGDKGHTNGVHFEKEERTKAIKAFVKDVLSPDLLNAIPGGLPLFTPASTTPQGVHDKALELLDRLHRMPVQDAAERSRLYHDELLGSSEYRSLHDAMDRWCACWFWPANEVENAPLPTTFANPSDVTRKIAARIAAQKAFFHWELEFPDVYRSEASGFDAMLGNPPWDIAKPNSKEFFSNIDPLYRSYGKQEALRYQTEYFVSDDIERNWLDYNADFRAHSNYLGYAASPYGDPAENENSGDRFSIARGRNNDVLHDRWRSERKKSHGYADALHSYRYQGAADINLYKTFLEQAHNLLRKDGRMGFIVPSGLYSDHGTGGLRSLFLDKCRWEWLFGFENREGIFEIHRAYKFNPVIIEKGGETAAIRTAFMRRKLEDWERAEELVTPYTREQVEQFSPRSKAMLEIQSSNDIRTLMAIQSNATMLGNLVSFSQQFDMTGDSKLFPPVTTWISEGYRINDYGSWVGHNGDIALAVFEGRMINQFDPSEKQWVSGRGRSAVWSNVPWDNKLPGPQSLMAKRDYEQSDKWINDHAFYYMKISSSTNSRTMIGTILFDSPSVYSLCQLISPKLRLDAWLGLSSTLNSFVFDFIVRLRLGGLNITGYVLSEASVPNELQLISKLLSVHAAALSFPHIRFAPEWCFISTIKSIKNTQVAWKKIWSVTSHDRLRRRIILDSVVANLYGLKYGGLLWILRDCDYSVGQVKAAGFSQSVDPKGFWRVDKESDPELRQTVLTLVAFNELENNIRDCNGDREKGIEYFLNQNDGEGWMLPETLRLADYTLGHDERAKEHQPVASRLGPRFYDWQLTQSPEESWRECHLHARNLLGVEGYKKLFENIEAVKRGEKPQVEKQVDMVKEETKSYQGKLSLD